MAPTGAPNPAARVHPAGRAAVVFAICGPELAGRRLTVDGRRVTAVGFGRVSLLLSYVDRASYAPDAIAQRSDDVAWLAHEARVHERAVERASAHGDVLPTRALTIVPDAALLDAYVREHGVRWARSFARLNGKRECAAHLYVGPHSIDRTVPYLVRVVRHVSRSSKMPALEVEAAVAAYARRVWTAAAGAAEQLRRVDRLERGELWSVTLLVDRGAVDSLATVLAAAASDGAPFGASAYVEAPRAPYSFV